MFIPTLSKLLRVRPLQRANYSTELPAKLVAFMENKDMVICWHPEQPFPYECTRPLPKVKAESKSVLKIGDKEVVEIFKKMKPELVVEKLSALTYTTKHPWYARSRDKRAKKTPMDRPYL